MTAALDGKVALVTGAARGLGAEVVRQMIEAGATVVAIDKRADDVGELADRVGAEPRAFDITDADAWATAVADVVDRHGSLDVVVNNAGVIRVAPILECTPDEFRKVVETNLVGTFLGVQAAGRAMLDQGGSIINLASPGAMEGTVGMPAYTSSKWGIRGLTRTAALEFGAHGIRVNTVVPGPMRTAMTRRPGWSDADYDQHYGATVPLGRMGSVEEVAALVVWLAGDASSYCTGSDFVADGGLLAGTAAPPSEA